MYTIPLTKDSADKIYGARLDGFGTFLVAHNYDDLKAGDTVELGVATSKHPLKGKLMTVKKLKQNGDVYIVEMEFKGGIDYENN